MYGLGQKDGGARPEYAKYAIFGISQISGDMLVIWHIYGTPGRLTRDAVGPTGFAVTWEEDEYQADEMLP